MYVVLKLEFERDGRSGLCKPEVFVLTLLHVKRNLERISPRTKVTLCLL
jgi:hypothetical protein